jgi:hypothetical protein
VSGREDLANPHEACLKVLDYFARVLLWGSTALGSNKYQSSGLEFTDDRQYTSLHNTLCFISPDEINVPVNGRFPKELDKLAAQICRLALAGLAREEGNAAKPDTDYRGHGLDLVKNKLLVTGKTARVGMSQVGKPDVSSQDSLQVVLKEPLKAALIKHGFDDEAIQDLFNEYQEAIPQQSPSNEDQEATLQP